MTRPNELWGCVSCKEEMKGIRQDQASKMRVEIAVRCGEGLGLSVANLMARLEETPELEAWNNVPE